jgi:hypothetical protein
MKYYAWFLGACFLVSFACTVDDDDRCPSGYYWVDDLKVCLERDEVSDAGGEECPSDAGVGLGAECMDNESCACFVADFCQKNPLNPPEDPGACTISDCVPADCVSDYLCCDCTGTAVPFAAPICVNEAIIDQLVGAGCTCE